MGYHFPNLMAPSIKLLEDQVKSLKAQIKVETARPKKSRIIADRILQLKEELDTVEDQLEFAIQKFHE
jgi:hypothetical protein